MGVILRILIFILKLLGILLLVILGVLLLVLLVPVRYEVVGEAGPEKKEASGHASWLLHLLHVGFAYREETFSYGIRVLGIHVFPRKEKPPKEMPAEEPETAEAAEEPIEAGRDGPVPLPGTGEKPTAEAQTDPADETARALGEQVREEQKKKPKKAAKETIAAYAEMTSYFDNSMTQNELYNMFRYRMQFGEAETRTIIASLVLAGAKFKPEN